MDYYVEVLKKYAVFSGRARRKEYWYFLLFNVALSFAIGFFGTLIGSESAGTLIGMFYNLAVIIPSIAVTVRRLHDTDRSGWWILIALIPFLGAIILLIFMALDSTPGTNKFGANPKEPVSPSSLTPTSSV